MNARALLLLIMLAVPGVRAAEAPLVRIDDGPLRGHAVDGVERFLGIPFAAPPVGDLRWRPPAPPVRWRGERDASLYGADCAQKPFIGDDAPLATTPSEDCLFINVWRPETKVKKKRPVMVWVHGGGFVNGGTSPAIYDGAPMARNGDVIVVSANHRLGRFGFFAHPALTMEAGGGPTANYGFMDQIAALRWVHDNIAAFGGDPDNVTIFGESAGGVSINMALTSPLARGLFHKAIVMSGGARNTLLPSVSLAEGEVIGRRFAENQGISDVGASGLAALRALPADRLVGDLNLATLTGTADYSGPVFEPHLFAADPLSLFRAGKAAPVPVMIGATSGDGWYSGGSVDDILSGFGPLKDEAARLYNPTGSEPKEKVGHRVTGDALFQEPARAAARAIAAGGQPVYLYRFGYVAEAKRDIWQGTQHAKELPFIFDKVMARYGALTTRHDTDMARRLQAYWIAFARKGVPAPKGEPAAPRLMPGKEQLIIFSNDGPVVGADPLAARLDVMEKFQDSRTGAKTP